MKLNFRKFLRHINQLTNTNGMHMKNRLNSTAKKTVSRVGKFVLYLLRIIVSWINNTSGKESIESAEARLVLSFIFLIMLSSTRLKSNLKRVIKKDWIDSNNKARKLMKRNFIYAKKKKKEKEKHCVDISKSIVVCH